jgi:DNA-binding IclR family transcriptional regulator
MATETTLKTVERALQVLEIVAASDAPLQVREVSDRLGHNITSTYHLVNTLIASGYLAKSDTGRLSIGRKASLLHSAYVKNSDFAATARPLIAQLAETSGETVYLTRWSGTGSVIEMVVESNRSVRVSGLSVGYSGLEDRRASGKAVLAQLSPAELEIAFVHLYPGLSAPVLASGLADLTSELDIIQANGFAFDDEEFEEGVCCIAAPYFGADGAVAGAVAASCPAQRVERLREIVRPQIMLVAGQLTEYASVQ